MTTDAVDPVRAFRDRPNILLIVSDDHGYRDRSAINPDPAVRTPSLDRLASDGATLTEAYVTAPICSPSRAGIIGGVHQARWGAQWFGSSAFPPESVPSLAERLAGEGYRTGYYGKVHYGKDEPGSRACPPHHGFDESFYGLAGTQMGRLNYLRHSRTAVEEYGDAARPMAVLPLWDGDDEVDADGFVTQILGDRAAEFIDREDRRPFFCMVAFNAVHNFCWQLPAEELERRGLPAVADWVPADRDYGDWYDDAISPNLAHGREYYLAQLELMDAQIGRLLDLLAARGELDDTLIVYTTDNGGSTCNYGDNAPFRGTKYTLWEGGVRVPMIVRWPGGNVARGVEAAGLVSTLDLTPTFLAAAGAHPASAGLLDGVDQTGVLRDGQGSAREAVHWSTGWGWAVRSGRWKLSWVDGDAPAVVAMRKIEHAEPGSGLRLFDLEVDPGESRDLAAERADVVARLRELHEEWVRHMAAGV